LVKSLNRERKEREGKNEETWKNEKGNQISITYLVYSKNKELVYFKKCDQKKFFFLNRCIAGRFRVTYIKVIDDSSVDLGGLDHSTN